MTQLATAVVDRIVDDETAVFLIEEGGAVTDEIMAPVTRFSTPLSEGDVVEIEYDNGEILDIDVAVDETERRKEAAQHRLDHLSEKLSDVPDEGA